MLQRTHSPSEISAMTVGKLTLVVNCLFAFTIFAIYNLPSNVFPRPRIHVPPTPNPGIPPHPPPRRGRPQRPRPTALCPPSLFSTTQNRAYSRRQMVDLCIRQRQSESCTGEPILWPVHPRSRASIRRGRFQAVGGETLTYGSEGGCAAERIPRAAE